MTKPQKKKSTLSEVLTHSDDDLKRYIGAITEEFQGRVDAVIGEFKTVHQKLDGHTEMIGEVAADVTILKDEVGGIKEDMSIMKEDIEVMKGDMATINFNHSTNVDKSEFFGLRHRVEMLERKGRK